MIAGGAFTRKGAQKLPVHKRLHTERAKELARMKDIMTRVIKVSPKKLKQVIAEAAKVIQSGGLVAFPTETVYGLGANALDRSAVKKIFEAKGRPLDNPIIVHVTKRDLHKVVTEVPTTAKRLIDKFWPGPLTLILKKRPEIPDEVTAGLRTVAVRCPANPIALALVEAVGPIAAPSANKSGRPSPTTARDVIEDLGSKIDLVLDGGPTKFGLESTVFDIKSKKVVRPGPITLEQIRKIVKGAKLISQRTIEAARRPIAPGMKYRHYAPKAKLILFEGPVDELPAKIIKFSKEMRGKIAIIATAETEKYYAGRKAIFIVGQRKKPVTIAQNLFSLFRKLDKLGYDTILSEGVEEREVGTAVMNRLRKAASKIIK